MVPLNGNAEPNLPDLPAPQLMPARMVGKPKPGQRTVALKAKGPATKPGKKPVIHTAAAPTRRVKLVIPSRKVALHKDVRR
jgi:hypothetical protein